MYSIVPSVDPPSMTINSWPVVVPRSIDSTTDRSIGSRLAVASRMTKTSLRVLIGMTPERRKPILVLLIVDAPPQRYVGDGGVPGERVRKDAPAVHDGDAVRAGTEIGGDERPVSRIGRRDDHDRCLVEALPNRIENHALIPQRERRRAAGERVVRHHARAVARQFERERDPLRFFDHMRVRL